MRLVKYSEDWRSILFVIMCFGLLATPFFLTLPMLLTPLWIFSTSLFCFCACVINHNHVHHPISDRPVFNQLFGILLTLVKGHTSAGVIQAHNLNHHVYICTGKDWIRPELAGTSVGSMRLVRYIFNASISMAKGRRRSPNKGLSSKIILRIKQERYILLITIVGLTILSFNTLALYVALPWAIGVIMLVGVNLLQHDQCIIGSRYNHSRNFTGILGNWFFFNNGYHAAHHDHPGLHWSQLADFHHHQIHPYIDPRFEKKSILNYLFKNYLFKNYLRIQ